MRRWHCYRKFSTSHRHHHQQPIESVCKVYEVIIVASKHFIIQLEYTHRFVSQRNRQDTYLSFSVYIKRVIVYYCYTIHFSIHIQSCHMHVDICQDRYVLEYLCIHDIHSLVNCLRYVGVYVCECVCIYKIFAYILLYIFEIQGRVAFIGPDKGTNLN